MRNLTIRRDNTFVACLNKMKVYIEDPINGDTKINGMPCSKLGDLKSGEEKTFLIGDDAAKVFVVFDKLTKNLYNEFYNIPAGFENIYLSGKNRYNPLTGNTFQFDGVPDEEVARNRKKVKRNGVLVLIVALVVGFLFGFLSSSDLFAPEVAPEVFSTNGMEITLTNEFYDSESEGFTACYDSGEVAVFVLREDFSLLEGFEDYTLEEYGNLVVDNNNFQTNVQLKNVDGLTTYEYEWTNPENNDVYKYFAVVYKGPDAFWLVQFATFSDNYEIRYNDFIQWAKSVKFTTETNI